MAELVNNINNDLTRHGRISEWKKNRIRMEMAPVISSLWSMRILKRLLEICGDEELLVSKMPISNNNNNNN